jgi:hypothetical protein
MREPDADSDCKCTISFHKCECLILFNENTKSGYLFVCRYTTNPISVVPARIKCCNNCRMNSSFIAFTSICFFSMIFIQFESE